MLHLYMIILSVSLIGTPAVHLKCINLFISYGCNVSLVTEGFQVAQEPYTMT